MSDKNVAPGLAAVLHRDIGSGLAPVVVTQDDAMKEIIDEASSTVTYIGSAAPGSATSAAAWRIERITVAGTVTKFELADGNGAYDNVWDNRAALSYS